MTPTRVSCGCERYPDGRWMLCPKDAELFRVMTSKYRCQCSGCMNLIPQDGKWTRRKYCSEACSNRMGTRRYYRTHADQLRERAAIRWAQRRSTHDHV